MDYFDLAADKPEPVKPTIQGVSYTHDGLIDEILMNPAISQREMAKMYGYTEAWMSIIVNSDAFQNRLAERKAEMIDPKIRASINDRLEAVAKRSLDRIMERLDTPGVIKDADLVSMAKLGVGDKNTRAAVPQTQNNLYVVNLPPPAANAQAWIAGVAGNTPRPLPIAEEVPRG